MTSAEKSVLRFVLSVTLAAACTAALWSFVPDHLSVSTDIVGNPIFINFDIDRLIYGYYFIAFLFPLLAIAFFQLTAWRGPLRFEGSDRPALFPLITVPEPDDMEADPAQGVRRGDGGPPHGTSPIPTSAEPSSEPRPERISLVGVFWIGARVGLPTVTIVLELAVIRSPSHPISHLLEGLAAILYVVAVILLTVGFRSTRARAAEAPSEADSSFWTSLGRANSLLAIVVVPLLYFVSRSTSVSLGTTAHLVHYPWLPWWRAVPVTLVCLVLWIRRDRRLRGPGNARELEVQVLTWVVTPVLLFLLVAVLPGAYGPFQGFDDAQMLAGPQLVFGHGLFPWRDVYLLHGLLADLFDGKIGMVLFGNTRWGSNAGLLLVVYPANLIVLYFFAAHFCRRNRLLLVALVVAIACRLIQGDSGVIPVARFLLLPIFFVLFDAVLRQPTWRRCWLFMATLVVGVILTPEELLFAPCLLIPLVLFEATGRTRAQSISTSFPRTWRCAVAGSVIVLGWFLFLASTGSLTPFIDYFKVFSSGHNLEGGLPAEVYLFGTHFMVTFAWTVPIALWLATIWRVVAKLRLRREWTVTDWVMVAAAAVSVIYYPKGLGRAESGHIFEAFSVSIPLLILWTVEVLSVADRAIRSALRRLPPGHAILELAGISRLRHVGTCAALVAVVAGTSALPATIPDVLRQVPSAFHPAVPVSALSALPRLGYTTPGSVDTAQIRELGSILDRYAGPSAPVFDYSNEPGIVNYLLDRTPGTRYYYAAVVQTQLAQQQEIAQLQKSRPPVVIFSNTTFGLNYDFIPQALRSFAVSPYLYAHYRPLLDVRGQLLLLRDDLFATAPPVPAGLKTTDLYFDTPACTFGDIPNFFALPSDIATQPRVRIPVTSLPHDPITIVTGWAVNAATKAPVTQVVAVAEGHVVAATKPSTVRADVIRKFHNFSAAYSGFRMDIEGTGSEPIDLYALDADGGVTPLAPTPGTRTGVIGTSPLSTVITDDGRAHPVVMNAAIGEINSVTTGYADLTTLHLPSGTSTTSYQWLELSAPAAFGNASFTLTDDPGSLGEHDITFNTLSRVGNHVYVGVGSCLQWQGYGVAHQLYLERSGKMPPTPISATFVK